MDRKAIEGHRKELTWMQKEDGRDGDAGEERGARKRRLKNGRKTGRAEDTREHRAQRRAEKSTRSGNKHMPGHGGALYGTQECAAGRVTKGPEAQAERGGRTSSAACSVAPASASASQEPPPGTSATWACEAP